MHFKNILYGICFTVLPSTFELTIIRNLVVSAIIFFFILSVIKCIFDKGESNQEVCHRSLIINTTIKRKTRGWLWQPNCVKTIKKWANDGEFYQCHSWNKWATHELSHILDLAKLHVFRGQIWVIWWRPVAPFVSLRLGHVELHINPFPPRVAKSGHFVILLCLTPDEFTRQTRALG